MQASLGSLTQCCCHRQEQWLVCGSMAAATDRQPLLYPPRLPPSTLRFATVGFVLISSVILFIVSFSNAVAPQPRVSFLLDRAVPPLHESVAFRNHHAHRASSHETLYQHDLDAIDNAGSPLSAVEHVKGVRSRLMGATKPQPLLFPVVTKPEPYSAPYNLYMLWSRVMQDMSPGATGDIFRRALRLGHVEGGEYRDPKFLPELAGRKFDDIAATCCSVVAVPPLSGGFIVYGTNGVRAEMIRAFLANGNAMVVAGGVVSLEFINRMFYSQLEPADGNYDEGPFRKSSSAFGPWQKLPFDSLGQIGTDVYAVKPSSLPEGSTVLFSSPDSVGAFIMPFCQRLNPQYATPLMCALRRINIVYELVLFNPLCRYGNPTPIIVPSSRCQSLKASGKGKCSCGTITYIGYDFHDNSITAAQDHAKYRRFCSLSLCRSRCVQVD